ncbi:hypothetical protein GGE43_002535 [Agrobacterium tumefaciens]|uniref:Uncharacterized protein n=1 Tax=Agrobacterium radiobacter TaxID=362 RepID=A0ABR6J902_AGRRD|nr:hypothetical protein [Agrobacterium radiobacter]TGE79029.1 hypothetical protein C9410_12835 [Rhizobium sp. SEMIA 439]MBB4282618.1 hypothetical protein [Agrobacterium radiobacter]MBB4318780.1 hypothetical protein [Agrobacterium radiobacter]MBB4324048.1 hypothetical protein [Agrobacterium radiobacter]MBB4336314.1 hypothetical protein [Agrobacterium radiobacter]
MDFSTWKTLDPVEDIAHKLGFDVSRCGSWDEYGSRFRAANDKDAGHLVTRAKEIAGVLTTGELAVLQAMLHAADFSRQADELCEGATWRGLDRTHGDNATAVALAIMRR